MFDPANRGHFLNASAAMYLGMIAVAFVLAWAIGFSPLESLHWNWEHVAWGVGGAIPLAAFFYLVDRLPLESLQRISRMLVEMLGPVLSVCRWYDLILVSLLVGFAEELLFRGVVQPALESPLGWLGAIVVSNVLFGLAHFYSRAYVVAAALLGVYMGLMLDAGTERNLLTPMLTHAVYDYVAFLLVMQEYRKQSARPVVYTDVPPEGEDGT